MSNKGCITNKDIIIGVIMCVGVMIMGLYMLNLVVDNQMSVLKDAPTCNDTPSVGYCQTNDNYMYCDNNITTTNVTCKPMVMENTA